MKFKLHQPTLDLLEGLEGLEIGGASHNPFGVNARNVAPKDGYEFYAELQRGMGEEPLPIDIDADAANIPLEDDSVDFVLSSHVVEHIPDVIGAFKEWKRLVRPGGYVLIIVPLPSALPSDKGKPFSTIDELKVAHKEKRQYNHSNTEHYWRFTSESLKDIVAHLSKGRYGLGWELVAEEEKDSKVGNGFFLAYKVN